MDELTIAEMRALLDGAPGKSDDEVRQIHADLARFAALTVCVFQGRSRQQQTTPVHTNGVNGDERR